MIQYSIVPLFKCSNDPMFQCVFLFIGSQDFLVYWSSGPLVHSTTGPLVHWTIGPMVHWYIGPLIYWSIGPLFYWSIGPVAEYSKYWPFFKTLQLGFQMSYRGSRKKENHHNSISKMMCTLIHGQLHTFNCYRAALLGLKQKHF